MPTDNPKLLAHVECGAHVNETWIESLEIKDSGMDSTKEDSVDENEDVTMTMDQEPEFDSEKYRKVEIAPKLLEALPSLAKAPYKICGIDKISKDRWRLVLYNLSDN